MSGGTVILNGNTPMTSGTVTVGNLVNTPAVLVLNGGTLTPTSGDPSIVVGSGSLGMGALVINSGVANVANELFFAYGPTSSDYTSYGALVMNGGTLIHSSWLGMARGNGGTSAGVGRPADE